MILFVADSYESATFDEFITIVPECEGSLRYKAAEIMKIFVHVESF